MWAIGHEATPPSAPWIRSLDVGAKEGEMIRTCWELTYKSLFGKKCFFVNGRWRCAVNSKWWNIGLARGFQGFEFVFIISLDSDWETGWINHLLESLDKIVQRLKTFRHSVCITSTGRMVIRTWPQNQDSDDTSLTTTIKWFGPLFNLGLKLAFFCGLTEARFHAIYWCWCLFFSSQNPFSLCSHLPRGQLSDPYARREW